jgi:peptide/nickel transport system permease protein
MAAPMSRWRRLWRNRWVMRLFKALLTVYIVTTITFFLVRLLPGNPADVYIQGLVQQYGLSYQEARNRASLLFAINLNQPIGLQYVDYLGNLAHGNLGTSITAAGTPVVTEIGAYLPWTLFSVGLGLLISFVLGVLLGLVMAYRRETWLDHVLSTFASIVSSVPNYLVAILMLLFLGVQLGWVNVGAMRGSYSPGVHPGLSLAFIGDVLYHAELPILTYVITTIGTWMLTMKSSTLNALEEDYVTVAKARGLPERRIMTAYVGRNAVLPVFTQMAIAAGFVVGGSVLVETIFTYQGVGWLLISGINARDYPVMQGVFLVITVSVVVANLLADALYGKLDPRIGSRGG